MASLRESEGRFKITFDVLVGGTGHLIGVLTDLPQRQHGSLGLVQRGLRVTPACPMLAGAVLRAKSGATFMLAEGESDSVGAAEQLWKSFQLVYVTGAYAWQRGGQVVEPITGLPRDDGSLQNLGPVWAQLLPNQAVGFDQLRYVAAAPLQVDDILNGKRVVSSAYDLGLYVGLLN